MVLTPVCCTCFSCSELGGLLKYVRPFLNSISKAKAARLVRSLLDLFLDMEAATGQEVELCLECIEWAKVEKRTFLRQALEVRLSLVAVGVAEEVCSHSRPLRFGLGHLSAPHNCDRMPDAVGPVLPLPLKKGGTTPPRKSGNENIGNTSAGPLEVVWWLSGLVVCAKKVTRTRNPTKWENHRYFTIRTPCDVPPPGTQTGQSHRSVGLLESNQLCSVN